MKRQVTREFLQSHPVFSLDEATSALAAPGGKAGTVERLKYHLQSGRLKSVAREIYAVVPPGMSASQFLPESFLVAVALRPEGVFSHHSALELLGAAHSIWGQCTLYVDSRRRPLALGGATLRFLDHPKALRSDRDKYFGTRMVERRGRMLRSTGPESNAGGGVSPARPRGRARGTGQVGGWLPNSGPRAAHGGPAPI